MRKILKRFRLLSELYSFLFVGKELNCYEFNFKKAFPSPFGVIFFLISKLGLCNGRHEIAGFPSPFGVIFFLIQIEKKRQIVF